ncbi:hypothetical protein EB796_016824 [Bugula neritina]|uniref:Uncharacterized protein n=1 Tax=Bugula neritina TaxID=10212 RepID=A0A7J7JGZ3_BUGNE|nr:hypothetical protein EB796_016824 [Bugula neritina]
MELIEVEIETITIMLNNIHATQLLSLREEFEKLKAELVMNQHRNHIESYFTAYKENLGKIRMQVDDFHTDAIAEEIAEEMQSKKTQVKVVMLQLKKLVETLKIEIDIDLQKCVSAKDKDIAQVREIM